MAQRDETKRQTANEILDTSMLIDGYRGQTTVFSIIEFPPAVTGCFVIWPAHEDYDTALRIATKLRLAGKPIGCADILIASICLNRKAILVTKDTDFSAVMAVEKEFSCKIIK